MSKVELKGLKEVTKNINVVIRNIEKDITEDLYNIGTQVGRLAQEKAPIESGDLRDSMNVIKEGTNLVLVSFGGELTTKDGYDYAIRQHEDLSLRHSGKEHGKVDGGEPKFLERSFKELEPKILERLEELARRNL